MKKILTVLAICAAVVFIILQFIRPNFSNPAIVPGETLEDSTVVPPEVQMLTAASCNDCHTNKTKYPWYSKVSPVSWFLADHIEEGRKELNFSVWNTYTPKKKIHKLEEVCEMLRSGAMPLPSYLWIHRDAQLSSEQSGMLCGWATAERERLQRLNPGL